MSFLEPVIASILGAAVTALAVFLKKNLTARAILKYGPLVQKAYDIIDPVLDKNLGNWNGSKVDKAFELAIESVSDGELSSDEIKKLAVHMAQAWLLVQLLRKCVSLKKVACLLNNARLLKRSLQRSTLPPDNGYF